jgi:O-antigen/teichoic acid export membrane protein
MSSHQSSFRNIFKTSSFIGGVQVLIIIISIIRSKIIAVLLGPTGMGIFGLLTSTTGLIDMFTNFGLGTSAIKNVAEANTNEDKERVTIIVNVLRKLVWITGILGTVITLTFSSLLSKLTFGNTDYTFAFIWISITLLFTQLTTGRLAILQGLRQFKLLAQSNLFGSLTSLIIIIPLYYFFRIKAIVPAIIVTSICTFSIAYFISRRIKISKSDISIKNALLEGKEMLHMGFFIGLTWLIINIVSYITRIFIARVGSIEEVGLYNAGYTIIVNYVNLFFTAIVTDYYPRLSGIAHNNEESQKVINHQAEFGVLVLTPFLMFFMVFVNIIILFLYSSKFIVISSMLQIAIMGILFFAAGNPIAYFFLAKGSKKVFFSIEFFVYTCQLILNLIAYKFFGITGLGVSYLSFNIIYLVVYYFICRKVYHFMYSRSFIKIFIFQVIISACCLFSMKFIMAPYNFIFGILLLIVASIFSFIELNNRIDFISLIKNFKINK